MIEPSNLSLCLEGQLWFEGIRKEPLDKRTASLNVNLFPFPRATHFGVSQFWTPPFQEARQVRFGSSLRLQLAEELPVSMAFFGAKRMENEERQMETIGGLFGCFGRQIDEDGLPGVNHLPGKPIYFP